MGIPFTLHMGFLITVTMGILLTIAQAIQLTISTGTPGAGKRISSASLTVHGGNYYKNGRKFFSGLS